MDLLETLRGVFLKAACGDREEGTWIYSDTQEAYRELHRLGFGNSVEAWQEGEPTP